ncbi:hypothetical protein [Mycoplasma seminis]|uniref:Uncharacterized protein n=1 Tax=Mycoplasma seminis TaxID=512749 RepID=A0ABY9HB80_9MOLU|nr:hypothetical protein [Mycoplasma seminis]WLP85862.1 hypothetical protein Q8852_01805 [Mycoplasma seminis]
MKEEFNLFQIYKLSEELTRALFKESDLVSGYIMPIFSSNQEILFCEVKQNSLQNNTIKSLHLYTKKGDTNYLIELGTIFKIQETDFLKHAKNFNDQLIKGSIAETNELEILEAFVQCLNERLFNTKLITINAKNGSKSYF